MAHLGSLGVTYASLRLHENRGTQCHRCGLGTLGRSWMEGCMRGSYCQFLSGR